MAHFEKQPDPEPVHPFRSHYLLVVSRAEAQHLLDPGGKIPVGPGGVTALPIEKPEAQIEIVVRG